MKPLRILGTTRYLGAPPGWKDEGKPCGFLAIRDEETNVGPTAVTKRGQERGPAEKPAIRLG